MDEDAAAALRGRRYYEGMVAFDRALAREMNPFGRATAKRGLARAS